MQAFYLRYDGSREWVVIWIGIDREKVSPNFVKRLSSNRITRPESLRLGGNRALKVEIKDPYQPLPIEMKERIARKYEI